MRDTSLALQPRLPGELRNAHRSARAARTLIRSNFGQPQHDEQAFSDVALPNGVWWLNKSSHRHDVLYGSNFVVRRPKLGGEGLIPYQALTSIQLMPEVPLSSQARARGFPAGSDCFFDVMDYTLGEYLDERPPQLQLPAPSEPQVAGLVLWHAPDSNAPDQEASSQAEAVEPSHPRRTKAVQYTCKRCGTVSTKLVNPHVWATGSVFARCDGCSVIHKLKDNLNVFHEVGGRGSLEYDPERLRIPAGLPQKPDRHIRVSGVEIDQ